MDVVEIVQRQVDAYNAHDLERFVATYAESVRVFRMPATEPTISGKTQFTDVYRARLSTPGLHAEILSRIVLGNKVIDHERVRGIAAEPLEALAVYELSHGLIENVWFFYPGQPFPAPGQA